MPNYDDGTSTGGATRTLSPVAQQAVQSGGGMLASFVNWGANMLLQKRAQKYAKQNALDAYNRDVDFWNMQNLYNSPEEKRKRLESAGISPWTEFGNLSDSAGFVKSPVAETISPYYGDLMPHMTIMSDFLQLKKGALENKAIETALTRQEIENRYSQLELDILQAYKDRQMDNDLTFKSAEQQEAYKEWQRIQGLYDEKIKEYQREKEKFEHDKELYKYDEPIKQQQIREREKQIEKLGQELLNLELEADNIKQKYDIGEKTKSAMDKELEIKTRQEKEDSYFSDRRVRIAKESGVDVNSTNWWSKTATEFTEWLNGMSERRRSKVKYFGKNNQYKP